MTNNQQMLDVLKSLKTRGWKFEQLDLVSEYPAPPEETILGNTMVLLTPIRYYRIPTIPEAEAVIDKMAFCWSFKTLDGCDYEYNAETGECYYQETLNNCNSDNNIRLLLALQLADKLAEAEPDKFKLIFEEK